MFAKLNQSLALCAPVLLLSAFSAVPAAAQETAPLGLFWAVDEWDGEVMTARSTEIAGEDSDQAVDEWDGEVMTARAAAGPRGRFLLLVVVEGPAEGAGAAVRSVEAPPAEGDEAVDEWDGEVMTARAAAGPVGSCQMQVGSAPRTFRVVRAFKLGRPTAVQP